MSGKPATFDEVLRKELEAIEERRKPLLGGAPAPAPAATPRETAFDRNLVGLTFSGGGIRSGTLGVGFLQGLAKLRLLRLFDYLSTVSGGGYAGAWLAAWVQREATDAGAGTRHHAVPNVEKQLDPSRHEEAGAPRFINGPGEAPVRNVVKDQEPEPLNHLRAHTRYMTPRAGLFSVDIWTLIASYLRNTIINLFVIVVMSLVLIFLARWLCWGFFQPGATDKPNEPAVGLVTYTGVGLAAVALFMMGWYRSRVALAAGRPGAVPEGSESRRGWFVVLVVLFLVVASVIACWSLGLDPGSVGERPSLGAPTRFADPLESEADGKARSNSNEPSTATELFTTYVLYFMSLGRSSVWSASSPA